jgi:hypothetical protein
MSRARLLLLLLLEAAACVLPVVGLARVGSGRCLGSSAAGVKGSEEPRDAAAAAGCAGGDTLLLLAAAAAVAAAGQQVLELPHSCHAPLLLVRLLLLPVP